MRVLSDRPLKEVEWECGCSFCITGLWPPIHASEALWNWTMQTDPFCLGTHRGELVVSCIRCHGERDWF